jgi:branched-chain amino acid transport system substrate-binding protein
MSAPRMLVLAAAASVVTVTAAQADIVIAAVGPITGQVAFLGEQQMHGAEVAVADLNARGGVLGERVRLLRVDDACDPEQAVAAAQMVVAEGVALVVGHLCSGASIPASKIYEAANILMISPASTNPALTDEGGPNVFRVIGRDDKQARVAGDYLAERWGDRRIAVLHDGQAYGEGLAEATAERLREHGVEAALYRAITPGQVDYSELVAEMQTAGIDIVYFGGYAPEAGLILRQARDAGDEDLQLVSGDALSGEDFWLLTGPAGAGSLFTYSADPRANPEAAPVIERFRAEGFEPAGYTLHTYAAVEAWAQAVAKAGTLDPDAVADALRGGEFTTVMGTISFDDKGDVVPSGFIWYTWQDGRYVPVEPQPAASR